MGDFSVGDKQGGLNINLQLRNQVEEDMLEAAISGAHEICNEKLVFETVEMDDEDVRLFLIQNQITSNNLHGRYLNYLEMYKDSMK